MPPRDCNWTSRPPVNHPCAGLRAGAACLKTRVGMNLSQSGDAAVPAMSAQSGCRVSMPHRTIQGPAAGEQRKYGTGNDSDGSETATPKSVLQRLRPLGHPLPMRADLHEADIPLRTADARKSDIRSRAAHTAERQNHFVFWDAFRTGAGNLIFPTTARCWADIWFSM